jgi:threonine dehydrogenase-like Zn-dependent dehydrogenase
MVRKERQAPISPPQTPILTLPDVRVVEAPVPAITEPTDVICKVTGTTVCGSDLHLYHKEIPQIEAGDILGHEWMGIVDEVGSAIKNVKKGDRVVASFQIA